MFKHTFIIFSIFSRRLIPSWAVSADRFSPVHGLECNDNSVCDGALKLEITKHEIALCSRDCLHLYLRIRQIRHDRNILLYLGKIFCNNLRRVGTSD